MQYWKYGGYLVLQTETGVAVLLDGDVQEFPTEEEAQEFIDDIIGGKENGQSNRRDESTGTEGVRRIK